MARATRRQHQDILSLTSITRPPRGGRPPVARHQSQPALMPQRSGQQLNFDLLLGNPHYGLLGSAQQLASNPESLVHTMLMVPVAAAVVAAAVVPAAADALTSFKGNYGPQQRWQSAAAAEAAGRLAWPMMSSPFPPVQVRSDT